MLNVSDESYNEEEYKLYMRVSIENSVYDVVDGSHYIDEGCKCEDCSKKRELLKKYLKESKSIMRVYHENKKVNIKKSGIKMLCRMSYNR